LFMLPIRPESDLKIPKITIKRSLSALILIEGNRDAVSALVSTYLFIEAFNKARELIKQRRGPLIDKLNFLLQLAEREDLMVNEELIKNKEQSQ